MHPQYISICLHDGPPYVVYYPLLGLHNKCVTYLYKVVNVCYPAWYYTHTHTVMVTPAQRTTTGPHSIGTRPWPWLLTIHGTKPRGPFLVQKPAFTPKIWPIKNSLRTPNLILKNYSLKRPQIRLKNLGLRYPNPTKEPWPKAPKSDQRTLA
jgi:hypothetical protein